MLELFAGVLHKTGLSHLTAKTINFVNIKISERYLMVL